jgi:uncharacterized membrane protein
LTVNYYTRSPLKCVIVAGCDTVTTSKFATVGPVPVALLGSLYYLTVIALLIYFWDTKRMVALALATNLTIVGVLASAWFVFAQIALIKAICIYCLVSAGTSTALFLIALAMRGRQRGALPA